MTKLSQVRWSWVGVREWNLVRWSKLMSVSEAVAQLRPFAELARTKGRAVEVELHHQAQRQVNEVMVEGADDKDIDGVYRADGVKFGVTRFNHEWSSAFIYFSYGMWKLGDGSVEWIYGSESSTKTKHPSSGRWSHSSDARRAITVTVPMPAPNSTTVVCANPRDAIVVLLNGSVAGAASLAGSAAVVRDELSKWGGGPLVWCRTLGNVPDADYFVEARPGMPVTKGMSCTRMAVDSGEGTLKEPSGKDHPVGWWRVEWKNGISQDYSCGAGGRYDLAAGTAQDPLVLTLHVALEEALASASCTSMAGEELAAVRVRPAMPVCEVRTLLAAQMLEEPERVSLLLPDGRVLGEQDLTQPLSLCYVDPIPCDGVT